MKQCLCESKTIWSDTKGMAMMTELDFKTFWDDVRGQLEKANTIILATCVDNHITTRTMAPLLDGTSILLSTGRNSLKIQQMQQNPHIALVLGGINIEAIAEVYGHPSTYPRYEEIYAARYPEYVEKYESSPEDVLVLAKIQKISVYNYCDGKACKDILDISEERAYRIEL